MLASSFRLLLFWSLLTAVSFAAGFEREIILAPQAGAEREDVEIRRCQERVGAAGAKPEAFERLGWAFVAKARRTLDAGYYKLAEKTADAMDAQFGASAESRALRGGVLHNLHRFRETEALARQLVAERGAPEDFGLLSDALMEQGQLGEAVEVLQRMVNLKPGAAAYSRIAHVRWLKGDLHGAIAAMEMAARASRPEDGEPYAWMLARLSGFYLQAGEAMRALQLAEAAARRVAAFPPALLARGRALLALNETAAAIGALQRAAELNPLPEYQWWLADALRAAHRSDEAATVEAGLVARGEVSDPRTFALFLATRGRDSATAVRLAREELANRADVFTHDALAWALAANGELAAADGQMRAALAERTQDARLFFHAGVIARMRGARPEAEHFFAEATALAATLTPSERARLAAQAGAALARVN